MELYGQIISYIWITVCALALIRRLNLQDEPKIAPSILRYIVLTAALGVGLCIIGLLKQPNYGLLFGLCFLAWSPISVKAMFYTPFQLLHLPIGFIAISALFTLCKLLFINKWETNPPDWVHFGDLLFGVMLVLGSIPSYLRAKELIAAETMSNILEKQTEALICCLHSLGPPPDENDRDALAKYNQLKDEALQRMGDEGRALWLRIQEDKLTPVERGKWNSLFSISERNAKNH